MGDFFDYYLECGIGICFYLRHFRIFKFNIPAKLLTEKSFVAVLLIEGTSICSEKIPRKKAIGCMVILNSKPKLDRDEKI